LAELSPGDWLLTQNETNAVAETLRAARAAGLKTCLNPAPITPGVAGYPLDGVDLIVINETEGRDLSGATTPDAILDTLLNRHPALAIALTLSADGAKYADCDSRCAVPAQRVAAVDTTAVGDTFLGYFLAAGP
jgi:ribokinase